MAREMKDSGIAWIGEIPREWKVSKLKYFVDCFDGRRVPVDAALRKSGPYPYWGAGSIMDYVDNYIFDEELVLLGEDGAPFFDYTRPVAFYINEKVWVNNHIHVLKPHHNVTTQYLVHYLNNVDYKTYINGSILNKLTQSNMNNITMLVPPLAEQRRIADFLDAECARIDAVIEKTRASIEEYKKLKQSVITQAVTKGIRPGRKMKDSGIEWIGEIASDFELKRVKHVCEILDQYRSPITADQRNQDADILYDYYGASGAIDKIDGYTIDDHVMLIGEDGANLKMRNLPLMYEVNGKAWINNHAHILKPRKNVDFSYLFYTLESLDINPYITGAAQPKLSQDNLKNIWLPVPTYSEQAEISQYLKGKIPEIDSIIGRKNQFLVELEDYKKSLIFEYVTGKKEVG